MKQAIVIIKNLKMSTGKAAAQASHASVEATLKSDKKKVDEWRKRGMKKVVLKVETEEELLKLKKEAEKIKLVTALIKDAGRTFFKKPTITCLAIGPDKEEKIDKVTGKLKML
ncbi:MAG: peptidyl-tRNA hydrolase Pth2 [Candidatus Nanoarchaeia archaeon]